MSVYSKGVGWGLGQRVKFLHTKLGKTLIYASGFVQACAVIIQQERDNHKLLAQRWKHTSVCNIVCLSINAVLHLAEGLAQPDNNQVPSGQIVLVNSAVLIACFVVLLCCFYTFSFPDITFFSVFWPALIIYLLFYVLVFSHHFCWLISAKPKPYKSSHQIEIIYQIGRRSIHVESSTEQQHTNAMPSIYITHAHSINQLILLPLFMICLSHWGHGDVEIHTA